MMHGRRQSDSSTVPEKPPNPAVGPATEVGEGRELAKGNSLQCTAFRTQSRTSALSTLERVRLRKGGFTVLRRTMRQRWQAKLRALKLELVRRMHLPVPEVGRYGCSVVLGHIRYYGVPLNYPSIRAFRWAVGRPWWQVLRRRSQTGRLRWSQMTSYLERWLPVAPICHPYPAVRCAVMTQGKSRMR